MCVYACDLGEIKLCRESSLLKLMVLTSLHVEAFKKILI